MPIPSAGRPTWAEIDLDSLAFNFHSIRSFIGAGVAIMAVVKADSYGHGAVECARRLQLEGAEWLAVATLEEGTDLRRSGISIPILVLGGIWPGQEPAFLDLGISPIIFAIDQAERFNNAAAHLGTKAKVHIKIDTGMNRIGFRIEAVDEIAGHLGRLKNLEVDGLMTHFSVADKLSEAEFTERQIASFKYAVEAFIAAGHEPTYVDIANSPGAVVYPASRLGMVRIGGLLYGLGGDVIPAGVDQPDLLAVMSVRSKIAMIKNVPKGETIGYGRTFTTERDSVIATIPIGYNDGYDRRLSNKGKVIIRGEFAPVVGRVSMDWLTVDVTDIPNADEGESVTILGQEGTRSIKAEDIARDTDTISYEVTCGIAARIPRIYN